MLKARDFLLLLLPGFSMAQITRHNYDNASFVYCDVRVAGKGREGSARGERRHGEGGREASRRHREGEDAEGTKAERWRIQGKVRKRKTMSEGRM